MDINEPKLNKEDVMKIDERDFCADNVCIVTGVGTGIGRATAVAAPLAICARSTALSVH